MVSEELDRLRWSEFKELFKSSYGEYPSTISALFIIGLEKINLSIEELTKEQKQDVIHVGLCEVMSQDDFYRFEGYDEEGWPHYNSTKEVNNTDIEKQENYIKNLISRYYEI